MEALGDALEQRLGVELQQPRVVAHHAARDRRSRQRLEALLLERLDLARDELQLLRGVARREAHRLARAAQLLAYAGEPRISQIHPAAAPGIRPIADSAGAAGWRSPA